MRVSWLLGIAAALVQIAHAFWFQPFVEKKCDMAAYIQMAHDPLVWPHWLIYYQPLYPLLLRAVGISGVIILQVAFLGLATILAVDLVYRVTGRVWATVIAAALVGLDIRLTLFGYQVLTEATAILLTSVWLWASWRALAEKRRDCAALAAGAMVLLALTRSMYLWFMGLCLVAIAVWFWRSRQRPVRLYGIALAVALLPLAGRAVLSRQYIGTTNGNTGINLVRLLHAEPRLIGALPAGDPLQAYWQDHRFSVWELVAANTGWKEIDELVTPSFFRAVKARPCCYLRTVWMNYRDQGRANSLLTFAGDPNVVTFLGKDNLLFNLEYAINWLIYGGPVAFLVTTLCLLAGIPLVIFGKGMRTRLPLTLLVGFVGFTALASAAFATGLFLGIDFRWRIMYELPAILLWVIVPVSLWNLFVRSNDARYHT